MEQRNNRTRGRRGLVLRGAIFALVALAVAAFVGLGSASAEDSLTTGVGSPEACMSENITGTVMSDDPGQDMDLVSVAASAGTVVDMICIKTGADIFPLGGTGACANVPSDTTKSSHSPCIFDDGQYADGPCYAVSGMGTAKVTVSRKGTCPTGSGISHVDFLERVVETPTATDTPTDTATATATDTATVPIETQPATATDVKVGGVSLDPDTGGPAAETSESAGGSDQTLGVIVGLVVGMIALTGTAWYARKRWLS